ncbi:hypothetical protein PBY51_006378 [Eleginops maclovinus]|uniref:Uncharacterized protein n=1 Tax=Eleginops maclovinus TaxID=56733 RepID=A0AAN8AE49_ELEMC|nr:hypothetical protein PBY51_006378 [Eleginops maclovinus]
MISRARRTPELQNRADRRHRENHIRRTGSSCGSAGRQQRGGSWFLVLEMTPSSLGLNLSSVTRSPFSVFYSFKHISCPSRPPAHLISVGFRPLVSSCIAC